MSEINLVLVSFEDRSKAYEALSRLNNAGAEGRVGVQSAAIVLRDDAGNLSIPEAADNVTGLGALGGGLVGSLIGIIGGPVGVLLGLGAGAVAGGLGDADRAERGDQMLLALGDVLPPGGVAAVAEVEEYTPEVVNGLMSELGGTVVRRPAYEVLAELEAAEEAYDAAQKEARRVLREEKKAARKEDFEERKAKLRAKLGRD